jgi:hypothetical protein
LSLFQRLGDRQAKPNILFEWFAGVFHLNGFSDPRFSRFYLPPDPGNRWLGHKRQDVWHLIDVNLRSTSRSVRIGKVKIISW